MSNKHIVITGSTRGIGIGLAKEFLSLGCDVTVNGRSAGSVDAAVTDLRQMHPDRKIAGVVADVSVSADSRRIWHEAKASIGGVDVWINNAGLGQTWARFQDLEESEVRGVVDVNIIGTLNGCRAAIEGMSKQGGGQIYNLAGYGSDGRVGQLLSVYGMSKRAVSYLTRALVKELAGTPVTMGELYPGMVVTDLLLTPMAHLPEEFEKAKKIFNIIADPVEPVTRFLASRILANKKHGARISWINSAQITFRFLFAPFRRRNLFPTD